MQIDVEYRKSWDKTAIALDVVDTDPAHRQKSQIIYWEMLWPVSECAAGNQKRHVHINMKKHKTLHSLDSRNGFQIEITYSIDDTLSIEIGS